MPFHLAAQQIYHRHNRLASRLIPHQVTHLGCLRIHQVAVQHVFHQVSLLISRLGNLHFSHPLQLVCHRQIRLVYLPISQLLRRAIIHQVYHLTFLLLNRLHYRLVILLLNHQYSICCIRPVVRQPNHPQLPLLHRPHVRHHYHLYVRLFIRRLALLLSRQYRRLVIPLLRLPRVQVRDHRLNRRLSLLLLHL